MGRFYLAIQFVIFYWPTDAIGQKFKVRKFLLSLFASISMLAAVSASASADGQLMEIEIGRENARLPVYVMPNTEASATLILLPGGDAGTGKIVNGKPTSRNFLSRTRNEFYKAGFNVMVVFRATDLKELDYEYRISEKHVGELARVISFAKTIFNRPVWLIGTSRGTVSATATAISLGQREVQGLVLTSSVTSKKIGAISTQNIAKLTMPTLVVHHKSDACEICVPHEASLITTSMEAALIKKFVMIEGGSNPTGRVCGARHWHGFINYEKETAKTITDWIKKPNSD